MVVDKHMISLTAQYTHYGMCDLAVTVILGKVKIKHTHTVFRKAIMMESDAMFVIINIVGILDQTEVKIKVAHTNIEGPLPFPLKSLSC